MIADLGQLLSRMKPLPLLLLAAVLAGAPASARETARDAVEARTVAVDAAGTVRALPGSATGRQPIAALAAPSSRITAFASPGRSDTQTGYPPPVTSRIADSVAPVPAAPAPSGGILGGFATWFDTCPDCAAAGPALRRALGSGWRGSLVDVASRYGSATLRLTDWCACKNRDGLPTLLDVSVEAFGELSPYPARSARDPGYVAVSIEIAGPRDPADDRMRIEDGGPTPPPTDTQGSME